MKKTLNPTPPGKSWTRYYLTNILTAAIETGEYRFAQQVSLAWLAYYPGDLPVNYLRSKALVADGSDDQAYVILQNLVNLDPEFREAQDLLYKVSAKLKDPGTKSALGCAVALGETPKHIDTKTSKYIGWSYTLALARQFLLKNELIKAEKCIQQVLGKASHTPLSGVTHMKLLLAQEATPKNSIQNLAEHYHKQWPECLQFSLILADVLMDGGEIDRAVSILHQAASKDLTGQVANRIWGVENPYQNLWPQKLEAPIFVQMPFKIAAYFGWNLLPGSDIHVDVDENDYPTGYQFDETLQLETNKEKTGTRIDTPTNISPATTEVDQKKSPAENSESNQELPSQYRSSKSETLKKINNLLDEISLKRKQTIHPYKDGRFPIYVVFTTKKGLYKKYGEKTTEIFDKAMRKLVAAIRNRLDWGSILIYADDPISMAQYGLKPVPSDDPWKLKLALTDLDHALGKRGARIGALLLIGGPEVIPFHNLPNPTDDTDASVPSDNPYATRDENYFVPEWPVGRLPGGKGKDPGLLLSTLRLITEHHDNAKKQPENPLIFLWNWIAGIFKSKLLGSKYSFGFTAEAWQQASGSVFRPIGDPRNLVTSPPVVIHEKQPLPITQLGYFNLHGVKDSAEWFGQRDPRNGDHGLDFPIALHPKDVVNGNRSPQVIFSEACYAAYIFDKSIDEALSLKFLASGCQAIIGSTVISYGSVTTPLNAADLLGKAFWGYFKDGFSAGEALYRAKIFLAKEMHQRQGYLDGEDQKTLISFVLYGDPLAQEKYLGQRRPIKKFPDVLQPPEEIKTICDRVDVPGTSEPLPKDVVANVKKIVDQYLPGMRDAQFWISHEHEECCSDGHVCPTSQLGIKPNFGHKPDRRVVTLNKQVTLRKHVHDAYARLTIDNQGNVVKLAVSR
jgi:hypothetical protein